MERMQKRLETRVIGNASTKDINF